jgi:small-conductance mechanosensitive channel
MKSRAFQFGTIIGLILITIFTAPTALAAEPEPELDRPEFGITEELGDVFSQHAATVRKELKERTRSLFDREPLGFSWATIDHLIDWLPALPAWFGGLMQALVDHSRLLGAVGTFLILIFFFALIYSLLGQKRLMARIHAGMAPLQKYVPPSLYHSILPILHVFIAALFPLLLLLAYTLIGGLIDYEAAWFRLLGRLLVIWAAAAMVIRLLRELLVGGLIDTSSQHARSLYRLSVGIVLYSTIVIGLYHAADVFDLRADVLALVRFAVSLSIVLVLFFLLLKKRALLSLLPDLPHPSYLKFLKMLERYYFPLLIFCLLLALLWSVGYRTLGRVLLVKIWSSGAAYLLIMVLYHSALKALTRWYDRADKEDEAALLVYRSCKSALMYGTALVTGLIVLNMLGLLVLFEQALSFPVFRIGDTFVTFWTILKAALVIVSFAFVSKLLQAYLDYRIYPSVGVEPGLGYALNTFLKYFLLIAGVLVALNVIGLDLRLLLVFAGAIGIGIGLGLQNMAANVIAGFSLIFGGKLRKGDWIEVGGTMGMVTDIHLRATKVRTRANIEYIIPNTEFISGTLINYTLSSPMIRIDVPVGVSYDADPRQVEKILLTAAMQELLVSKDKAPIVRFVEYGDSSLNFQLLIWIDVRTTPRRRVRSDLYFAIFEEFKKAGIEIPFPQRDIHIRSTVGNASPGEIRS